MIMVNGRNYSRLDSDRERKQKEDQKIRSQKAETALKILMGEIPESETIAKTRAL